MDSLSGFTLSRAHFVDIEYLQHAMDSLSGLALSRAHFVAAVEHL